MSAYDALAADYDGGRTGYAHDLYDALVSYGLKPSMNVLDVGCGTGLASGPLAENGFSVTGVDPSEPMLAYARKNHPTMKVVAGRAEALPFKDRSFDALVSAQTFHHVERAQAMREALRVLRPGGIIAIWWKRIMSDDPVEVIRRELFAAMDLGMPPSGGLNGGFREFYGAPLAEHTLRVIPWRRALTVGEFVRYERSRKVVRDALGGRADTYFSALEARLIERYGGNAAQVSLAYMHYVYLGKTP